MPVNSPLFSLTDKVFIVTGASSGIGLEIARGLAEAGATVGFNSRNAERLEACCRDVPRAFALPFDVTDLDAAGRAVDEVIERFGQLDGVVANAGARDRRPLEDIEPEDFRALLETNLVAPYQFARLAARHMLTRGSGRIIFVTSLAGDFARPGDPAYPSSKSGLAGLMRGLAVDLGPHGITVNAIAPGVILSETNKHFVDDPDWDAMIRRTIPLARWGQPSELAGAAVFLASEAGSYVNGHTLRVDGGASVQVMS
ncbi:MAG: SDR family oxidoreductase [Alphaproteobacteria bacterium]|nr:SDR family oxidoreductase [Alphaproteobacteria bacterium]